MPSSAALLEKPGPVVVLQVVPPGPAARPPLFDLVTAAVAGDLDATTQLIRHLTPAVSRAVRAALGPGHADVEDVVQLSLIALVRALPSFRGECHPAGFASRIAMNTAVSSRRRVGPNLFIDAVRLQAARRRL